MEMMQLPIVPFNSTVDDALEAMQAENVNAVVFEKDAQFHLALAHELIPHLGLKTVMLEDATPTRVVSLDDISQIVSSRFTLNPSTLGVVIELAPQLCRCDGKNPSHTIHNHRAVDNGKKCLRDGCQGTVSCP